MRNFSENLMLHEDNVMEKVKSVDAVEFTAADKKAMTHAAYAQCFFILAQVMAFPSLGVAGAMVAALCGMMPWLTKFAKEAPSRESLWHGDGFTLPCSCVRETL
jgi:hypothetical protein